MLLEHGPVNTLALIVKCLYQVTHGQTPVPFNTPQQHTAGLALGQLWSERNMAMMNPQSSPIQNTGMQQALRHTTAPQNNMVSHHAKITSHPSTIPQWSAGSVGVAQVYQPNKSLNTTMHLPHQPPIPQKSGHESGQWLSSSLHLLPSSHNSSQASPVNQNLPSGHSSDYKVKHNLIAPFSTLTFKVHMK